MRNFILLTAVALVSTSVFADVVKQSSSGICHDSNSSYYSRINKSVDFESMTQCFENGGTPYKGYSYSGSEKKEAPSNGLVPKYERDMYLHWKDVDGDCQNSRHEALIAQSVSAVGFKTGKQCNVLSGVWNDPYSGKRFYNPGDLDADHVVPLKWVHEHGGYLLSDKLKEAIANNPANIIVVDKSLNREKGAKPPMEWLPPNEPYQCQYVLRFERIMKKYGLRMSQNEAIEFSKVKNNVCSK